MAGKICAEIKGGNEEMFIPQAQVMVIMKGSLIYGSIYESGTFQFKTNQVENFLPPLPCHYKTRKKNESFLKRSASPVSQKR